MTPRPYRVLLAAAEFAPVARVGGLAEATAGLVAQLRADGVDVEVVVPDYGDVVLDAETTSTLKVPTWAGPAAVRRGLHPVAGAVTLVSTAGMARPHPYLDADGDGWPDNDRRFFGFSAAVAALVRADPPDVLHLNDWHTALTLGFLADAPPTVFTIHTLGYQGVSDGEWLDRVAVGADDFTWFGQVNPVRGAIRRADRIVAVSPTYAREIVTEADGMGLHADLAARGDALVGIRNGIDTSLWSPTTDAHLPVTYRASSAVRGKAAARAALADAVGLPPDPTVPLFGVVSRLVDQKGMDLLAEAAPFMARMPAQLVALGAGERPLVDALRAAALAAPATVAFVEGYDVGLAHQIFAGSDLLVMPSRFEPCGLAQMQAMAYGTLPVVTDVGGLHDTVVDADDDPTAGTGILVPTPTAGALVDGLHRGARLWRDRSRRAAARNNGMARDWSWAAPAAAHAAIYAELAAR